MVARPRNERTPAFLRSAPTPLASRATIASFQAIVLAKSSVGAASVRPMAFSACGSVERVGGVGGVDDRLRRDAADMQAGAAEASVLDQHRVEAEFAGADRRDIAAGAAADDENLAAQLGHAVLVTFAGLPVTRRERGGPGAASGNARQMEPAALDTRFRGYDNRQSSMNSAAGASRSARTRWMKVAASWPSTTR